MKTRALTTAAFLLFAALAGCAPMQWVDMRTGSPEGAATALDECHRLARDEAWRGQWYYNWPPHFYEPYSRYRGARRPFWEGRLFSDELYFRLQEFCMRSRGFQLIEVEKEGS